MNLIFLDIDGVLNCQVFYEKRGWPTDAPDLPYEQANICPDRVAWIAGLCLQTNSKVVISSTWRHGKTVDYFQDIFDSMCTGIEVIGLTPSFHFQVREYDNPSVPRGCEIKDWLRRTPAKYQN